MVTQEMLEAAMVEAVKRGMFPKDVPADQYITAWDDMRAVLEAAQQCVEPTAPRIKAGNDFGYMLSQQIKKD